jgi:hypothetical protein
MRTELRVLSEKYHKRNVKMLPFLFVGVMLYCFGPIAQNYGIEHGPLLFILQVLINLLLLVPLSLTISFGFIEDGIQKASKALEQTDNRNPPC